MAQVRQTWRTRSEWLITRLPQWCLQYDAHGHELEDRATDVKHYLILRLQWTYSRGGLTPPSLCRKWRVTEKIALPSKPSLLNSHAKPHMWHLSTRNWVISLLFSSNVLYVSSLACMEISLEGVSEHMDNRFGIFKCFQGLGSQWGASKTEAEPWVRITCGAQEGGALGEEPSLGAGHTKKGLGSTIQSLLAGSGAKQSASLPSCLWLCH